MRDAMAAMGGDPARINPLAPAELVIDHSVQVDAFGTRDAFRINAEREFERNQERYVFLRWGQQAFEHFKVVPPDTGIVHQVNLEYLARVVFVEDARSPGSRSSDSGSSDGSRPPAAYPDTLVGTDSHTTMVNGLGVLGWGVGGIEAEAAMLGQPLSMLIPQVVGFRLHGELPEGATATDLVLTVTQMLRERGVVGKFVEFHGAGLAGLPLADRATIGNMSPEFGSTCAIFPIDAETLRYLRFTGRPAEQIELVEAYAREQGLWHDEDSPEPAFSELARARPRCGRAEPRRPQAPAGPGLAERRQGRLPRRATRLCIHGGPAGRRLRRGGGGVIPGLRSTHRPQIATLRARPRPRGDRGDHQLHEHLQPLGDDRGGDPRAQRGRPGP